MRSVHIPTTSPERYVSFMYALNLRYRDEYTGDWHFENTFFIRDGNPDRSALLAGPDGRVDTNPSLKNLGVREMSDILISQNVIEQKTPVYVANHYRALADLVMVDLKLGRVPTFANVSAINDWLDSEDQIKTLKDDYLVPLSNQLSGDTKNMFDIWLETVSFQ